MSPEKQRIAIAEFCGWEYVRNSGWWLQSKNHPVEKHGRCGTCAGSPDQLPDYLNDLNAMHEAEERLTPEMGWLYFQNVCQILESNSILSCSFNVIKSTAAQRAEALLRTISKWEDA